MTSTRIVKVLPAVDGGWTWNRYHASPYTGCSYSCAYCYNLEIGTTPTVVADYENKFTSDLAILPRDVVTVGDYQPLEKQERAIRRMLELCAEHAFPVHLMERDPRVADDTEVLLEIARTAGWAAVSISLLTVPGTGDSQRAVTALEPDCPDSAERLAAMKTLSQAGVLTGTAFMPVVPFLFDSLDNIESVARATKESGGKYLLFGDFTIPAPLDYLFFQSLESEFSTEAKKISELMGPGNEARYRHYLGETYGAVKDACAKYDLWDHLPRPLSHFPEAVRERKAHAGALFLECRDLYLSGAPDTEWQEVFARAQELESIAHST